MNAKSIVAIGASAGGTDALQVLFSGIDGNFPLPIVVVLHRGESSDLTLVNFFQGITKLRVREPEDKEKIVPGWIYFAPANYHLLVEGDSFSISTDPRVNFARPSIDVLFDSVAEEFGENAIGIVLTGASSDGAAGLAKIKQNGGYAIVQDPRTARTAVMPKAAIEAAKPDLICRLEEMFPAIEKISMNRR